MRVRLVRGEKIFKARCVPRNLLNNDARQMATATISAAASWAILVDRFGAITAFYLQLARTTGLVRVLPSATDGNLFEVAGYCLAGGRQAHAVPAWAYSSQSMTIKANKLKGIVLLKLFKKPTLYAFFLLASCLSPLSAVYAQSAPQFQSEKEAKQHCPKDRCTYHKPSLIAYRYVEKS
jgi:hypothetical protein